MNKRLPVGFFPTSLVIFLSLLALTLSPIYSANASASGEPARLGLTHEDQSGVHVLHTDAQGIVLELTAPSPEFTESTQGSQPCQVVHLPGITQDETPGRPALPVKGAMLGIPQDAQPTLTVLAAEPILLTGKYDLCPTEQPIIEPDATGGWKVDGYAAQAKGDFYQADRFIPGEAAEIVATGSLRSQRYAEVRFNPLQYNPASGEVRYFSRIRIEVRFNPVGQAVSLPLPPEGQADSLSYINEGDFEDPLQDILINYEQARAWRSLPASSAPALPSIPLNQPTIKIQVNQSGLYKVDYAALQTAGAPIDSLDPRTFQLYNLGSEVALDVPGQENGVFDSGEYLLFYGQPLDTKFTTTNVYWLTWGGALGLRMASSDGTPTGAASVPDDYLTTVHIEENKIYSTSTINKSTHDHWYWEFLYASSGAVSMDFSFNLPRLASAAHTATVRGMLKGYAANPNHHTRLYLNGNLISDNTFPSGAELNISVDVTQAYLVEGANILRVECPLDEGRILDEVMVDMFEIDYYRAYQATSDRLDFDGDQPGAWEFRVDGFSTADIEVLDVTAPHAPLRFTGAAIEATANGWQAAFEVDIPAEHRYLAQEQAQRLSPLSLALDTPSNWKATTNGADYLIITHADFLSQAQTLAAYRAGQGLRVQVIDVQDLYDEFNDGIFDPEAIKSFLAYAYANWVTPAPSYVLLMGDGHFDFKNNYGWNESNYIPPYLAEVDPWLGETATDNRYVSVSGGDILPDMFIGRFPVKTPVEAQAMVNKVLNYEQTPPQGDWNTKQTFVADNADGAGNFPVLSDNIINTYVPSTHTVDKIYYGINYATGPAAKTAIINAINQGRLLVQYTGHAGIKAWAGENLFHFNDLPSLANGNMLPFMMPMTCAEGYFIWPSPTTIDRSSISESIVRLSGKGAIASFAPTGYGLSSGHDLLDRSVFDDVFNNNQTRLGYITTHAKYYLFANSSIYKDLVETYLLFGDPALKLQAPSLAPTTPTNLQAQAFFKAQIKLTWQDDSKGKSEFRIERSLDGSTGWTQIAVVDNSVTSYSDPNLACNTPYYYRVRAYRSGDDQYSEYSNTAHAVTFGCQSLFIPLVRN